MADAEKKLSALLQRTGLNAKRQDGKILLYNRDIALLSKGVAVSDLQTAIRMVSNYLGYMRTHGFVSVVDWAKDHQYRPIPFKEVPNKADPQSAYYVAGMSTVSRVNLMRTAQELRTRVRASRNLQKEPVTDSAIRRYLKIRKIAAIYMEDSEKVA